MPGRARTRARWTSARGGDDRDLVDRARRRRSRTAAGCRTRPAARRRGRRGRRRAPRRPRGGRSPRARFIAAASPSTASAERGAVDARRAGRAGKARLDRRDDAPGRALQPVDRGVGVEHRHALVGEHRRDGRLAHADRAGEAQASIMRVSSAAQLVVAVARRRGAEEQLERERGLADQHLQPVDRLEPARARLRRAAASRAARRRCRRRPRPRAAATGRGRAAAGRPCRARWR